MGASAWTIYNKAKERIGNGLLNLSTTPFRMALFKSGSNFGTATLENYGSLTSQVTNGNGYVTSGKTLAGEDWTVGASAKQFKFDADDPATWTASGGALSLIKGAVIFASGTSAGNKYLLCYASLSTAAFTLADGNTLTIQFNASGIFTMT